MCEKMDGEERNVRSFLLNKEFVILKWLFSTTTTISDSCTCIRIRYSTSGDRIHLFGILLIRIPVFRHLFVICFGFQSLLSAYLLIPMCLDTLLYLKEATHTDATRSVHTVLRPHIPKHLCVWLVPYTWLGGGFCLWKHCLGIYTYKINSLLYPFTKHIISPPFEVVLFCNHQVDYQL